MVDRRSLTMRDMAVAIGILVVSLVVVLGLMGGLSFGNSTDNGEAPTADVVTGFEKSAAALKLPLAIPAGLPESWNGNSFSQVDPFNNGGSRTVVRGGWLIEDGRFITLIQSPESAVELVTNEVGQGVDDRGSVETGGATWNIFPGQREEPVWVRTRDSVTMLITGSASDGDFRLLAAAVG